MKAQTLFSAWVVAMVLFMGWMAFAPCEIRVDVSNAVLGWLVMDDHKNCK